MRFNNLVFNFFKYCQSQYCTFVRSHYVFCVKQVFQIIQIYSGSEVSSSSIDIDFQTPISTISCNRKRISHVGDKRLAKELRSCQKCEAVPLSSFHNHGRDEHLIIEISVVDTTKFYNSSRTC